MLSQMTVSVLVDLIENKLAMMQIGDREELREVLTLQRCLAELQGIGGAGTLSASKESGATRGRRRKLSALIEEADLRLDHRQTA